MISTKPNRCKHCRERMPPELAHHVLHKDCMDAYAEAFVAKKKAKAAKEQKARQRVEKAMDRKRKEALKPIKKLIAEVQVVFNQYIRLRDSEQPCISCDETDPPMTVGGQWDAGHFKSRGAYPELRFDEDNCHKQCKGCNGGSKHPGKARTVAKNYEERLLLRIGAERVDRLNGPHDLKKWTRPELIALKAHYAARLKQLKESA